MSSILIIQFFHHLMLSKFVCRLKYFSLILSCDRNHKTRNMFLTGVVKKFSSYCKFASKAVHILMLLEAPSKIGKVWKNLYIYLFILFNCSNASVNKFPRFEPFNDLIKKYPIRTFQLSFRDTAKLVISSRNRVVIIFYNTIVNINTVKSFFIVNHLFLY